MAPRARRPRLPDGELFGEGESSSDYQDSSSMDDITRQIMADLGNEARDRQTAHDREHDRQLNQQRINRLRRCNQETTEEAVLAADNHTKINAWNNNVRDNTGTTLTSIAKGQYHRQNTATKLEHLQREGIDGDNVDLPRSSGGPSERVRGGPYANDRGRGRGRNLIFGPQTGRGDRPLDPAVDPDRNYAYKTGARYSRNDDPQTRGQPATRGGRLAHRGGHTAAPTRGGLNNGQASSSQSSTTPVHENSRIGGLSSRATAQRQARPWPPVALADKMEVIDTARKALGDGVSPAIADHAERIESVRYFPRQAAVKIPRPEPAFKKHLDDSEGFLAAAMQKFAIKPSERSRENTAPTEPTKTDLLTTVEPAAPILLPREELRKPITMQESIPRDDCTDGYPTPAALSGYSSALSEAPVTTTEPLTGLGISNYADEISEKSNIRIPQIESSLLDDDDDESDKVSQKALEPVKSPVTAICPNEIVINGVRYVRVTEKSLSPSGDALPPTAVESSISQSLMLSTASEKATQTTPSLAQLSAGSSSRGQSTIGSSVSQPVALQSSGRSNPFDRTHVSISSSAAATSRTARVNQLGSSKYAITAPKPCDDVEDSSVNTAVVKENVYSSEDSGLPITKQNVIQSEQASRETTAQPKLVKPLTAIDRNIPINQKSAIQTKLGGEGFVPASSRPSFSSVSSRTTEGILGSGRALSTGPTIGDRVSRSGSTIKPKGNLEQSKYAHHVQNSDAVGHGGFDSLIASLHAQGTAINTSRRSPAEPAVVRIAETSHVTTPALTQSPLSFVHFREREASESSDSDSEL